MAIRIPTTDQSKIFLGSQEIGAVYVGANKVWPDAPVIDPNAFIMRISVSAGQTITIPFANGTYNGTINWKDGTTSIITAYNDLDRIHTYTTGGDYLIELTGTFAQLYFNNTGDKLIVKEIVQWGNIGMASLENSFYGCSNLILLQNNFCSPNYSIALNNCFQGCLNLVNVIVPSSVALVSNYCFYECSKLESIIIPSANIGLNSFYYCVALINVEIGSCSSISERAFQGCSNSSMIFKINATSPPTLTSTNTFSGLSTTARIEVPAGSLTAYKTAPYWSTYANRIYAQS